jgi:hypothetical protein
LGRGIDPVPHVIILTIFTTSTKSITYRLDRYQKYAILA